MKLKKQALIIFVKNPELGKVKTRLAATIGDAKALEIYRKLLQKTMQETQALPIDKHVFYSNFIDKNDLFANDIYQKSIQSSGDLGEKMKAAFEQLFQAGYKQIGIIGSDCYQLTQSILDDAFEQLKTNDVVIGPSKDGGYYFLGMNQFYPYLFDNKKWSTDTVCQSTVKDVIQHDLSCCFLKELSDIDEEGDLLTMGMDNPMRKLPKEGEG